MFFLSKKGKEKKWKKGAIPYVFLVLGFFGAALTTEVMNIIHELMKSYGNAGFLIYAFFMALIVWPYVIFLTIKTIEKLYEE